MHNVSSRAGLKLKDAVQKLTTDQNEKSNLLCGLSSKSQLVSHT